MLKRMALIILVLLSLSWSNDENYSRRSDGLILEVGGVGLGLSINYEHLYNIDKKKFIALHVGVGSLPAVGGLTIPHAVTFDIGGGRSFLESGIGGTFWSGTTDISSNKHREYSYSVSPIIGYRLQASGGFLLRVYVSPVITLSGANFFDNKPVSGYGGVGFGFMF